MSCDIVPGTYGIPYNRGGKIVFYCLSEEQFKNILCHGLSQHGVTADGGFYGGKNSQAQGRSTAIGRNAKALNPNDGTTSESIQLGEGTNLETKTLKVFDWRLLQSDGKVDEERLPPFKIELRAEDGYIQWRYVGTTEWFNLISIDSITGDDAQTQQVDSWGPLTEQIIIDTQNDITTGRYIYYVTVDSRTDMTVPASLNGDKTGWLIGYNGDSQEWTELSDAIGIEGPSGKEVELRNSGTWIQWRYVGDPSWLNLVELATLKGDKGDPGDPGSDGATPIFQVDGGFIQYSIDDGTTWNNLLDISTLTGADGADGADGKNVELRTSGDFLQWRLITEPASAWISIYNLASLQGTDGKNPEFRVSGGYIQWRLVGDPTWINLIEIATLEGTDGVDGEVADFRVSGTILEYKYPSDPSWTAIIDLSTLFPIDTALNISSTNAVTNAAITEAINAINTAIGELDLSRWEEDGDGDLAPKAGKQVKAVHIKDLPVVGIKGTLGEAIEFGKIAYQSTDGKWYKARAVEGEITNISYCIVGGAAESVGEFTRYATIEGLTGLPVNSEMYLSQQTAGELTSTKYADGIIAYVGFAETASRLNVAIGNIAFEYYIPEVVFPPIAIGDEITNNYTITHYDNKLIPFNSATEVEVTIPLDLSIPNGWQCLMLQLGVGQIKVVAAAGVTLLFPNTDIRSRTRNSQISLLKYSNNVFVLGGDLA